MPVPKRKKSTRVWDSLTPRQQTLLKKFARESIPKDRRTGLDGAPVKRRSRGTQDVNQMDTGKMNKSQIRGYKKNRANLIDDDVVRSGAAKLPRQKPKVKPKGVWV